MVNLEKIRAKEMKNMEEETEQKNQQKGKLFFLFGRPLYLNKFFILLNISKLEKILLNVSKLATKNQPN